MEKFKSSLRVENFQTKNMKTVDNLSRFIRTSTKYRYIYTHSNSQENKRMLIISNIYRK